MPDASAQVSAEGTHFMLNSSTRRRNLLIVRSGDRSLHEHWLNGDDASARNFDLHISYFGQKDLSRIIAERDITGTAEKGPKFPGLVECMGKLGSKVSQYDYVGFPDDDLYATCRTWNLFFEIVRQLQPAVAQPALHRSSFYTYVDLLQVPTFRARWTNFVEVMMPVFSAKALKEALPFFGESSSGWGMDYLWPQLFKAENRTLCVVDDTPVLHTRAVRSGPLYSLLGKIGSDPKEDLHAFLSKHQLEKSPFQVYAALSRNGSSAKGTSFSSRYLIPKIRNRIRRSLSVTEISASNWLHML
jgi:hypothetical protein